VAARVCEYDTPASPEGKGDGVVMAIGGRLMLSVNTWPTVDKGLVTDTRVTPKTWVPAAVGTPVIENSPGEPIPERMSPDGSWPEVTDAVYGRPKFVVRSCE